MNEQNTTISSLPYWKEGYKTGYERAILAMTAFGLGLIMGSATILVAFLMAN